MIYAFYLFAVVLILISLKSLHGGVEYLRFFKREIAKPRSKFTPFVTVIAPCRGLDIGLEENLTALVEQDYPEYEVIFVVDDKNDVAVPVIFQIFNQRDTGAKMYIKQDEQDIQDLKNASLTGNLIDLVHPVNFSGLSRNKVSATLIVAPKANGCSQKVENLREAVLHADSKSGAFVFVDSDVCPSADWLRHLVAPLENTKVGAATGYRWFISPKPSFGSELRSVWNASIASALGPNTRSNFCWGGSMAMLRDVFDTLDMREKWLGTLADDFAVTRTMNGAGLQIVFVPQAVTASVENCTFGEMLEFTTRQMKITRVYGTKFWVMSFAGSGLFNAVMIAAFLIAIFSRQNAPPFYAAIFTLVIVTVCSIGKAWLRLNAVKLVLTKYKPTLRRQFWSQNTLWILSPAVFFYNSVAALVSRRMTWRGTTYELKSPTETVIISD